MDIATHIKEHEALGTPKTSAVVYAWSNTAQVYTSPIAGDPDLNNEEHCVGAQLVTGFLMPKAGIVEEIHFIAQGSTGTATTVSMRASITLPERDSTSDTGIRHGASLGTYTSNVAGNVSGDVTLAAGLAVAVPSQFLISITTEFTIATAAGAAAPFVQALLSAGPIPGVVGNVSGGVLTSAAQYFSGDASFGAVPPDEPSAKLQVSPYKGVAIYIKWRGE